MMEKSCHSSEDSTNNNNRQNQSENYLKNLNKFSHKISKPIRRTPLDHQQQQQHQIQNLQQQQPLQQQQQQPPVYNISKNDFRDVVQKLTGSPAHDRFSTPPPIHPPKPPSSRLQRIRPPPLAHLSNIPPPPLNNAVPPHSTITTNNHPNTFNNNSNNGRLISPLSPLPPFPAVHATAESPISAYMRYLRGSVSTLDSESKSFSGLSPFAQMVSPRWKNPNTIPQQPHQVLPLPSPTSAIGPSQCLMPNSPLAFGRIPSPRSPYPLLSSSLLFSPTTAQLGFPQFPPSLSPRWNNL